MSGPLHLGQDDVGAGLGQFIHHRIARGLIRQQAVAQGNGQFLQDGLDLVAGEGGKAGLAVVQAMEAATRSIENRGQPIELA